jgi:hypothetical protein
MPFLIVLKYFWKFEKSKTRINKYEIPCCHGNREHIFWLLVSWKIEKILVGPYSVSIFGSKEHHHGILVFWDFGRIMAIEPMEHRGSKLGPMGFVNISIKFLIERVPLCRIFEFWDFGRIASRPKAQMTMSLKLKMILTLRPFKRAIICPCPILIVGTRVMLVFCIFLGKGPGQGQIPGLPGHRSKIPDRTIDHCRWTDLCLKFQLSRWRTDGRTDGRKTDGFFFGVWGSNYNCYFTQK